MTEPEYIITDKDMYLRFIKEHQQALIEKYGRIPELTEMVAVDEEPDDTVPTCDDPECFMCD